MLKRTAAAIMLLVFPAAFGAPFTSEEYAFTADFPSAPTVGAPQGAEKDAAGNFISNSVDFMVSEQGVCAAVVSVETYVVPVTLDSTQVLTIQRDNFVKGLNASLGTSSPGTLDGHPSLTFSYDTPDHSLAGNGIVVFIGTKIPRDYIVVTMHTQNASAARVASLETFLNSFHLTAP